VQFTDPIYGIRAMARILNTYERLGINTIQVCINRWAPPSANNNTAAYIAFVCAACGVGSSQVLSLSAIALPLIRAIIVQERGPNHPYTDTQILAGIALAKVTTTPTTPATPSVPATPSPSMKLSPHFALSELTYSQTAARKGIANIPSSTDIANLILLCTVVLEPVRALLGVPIHVDSGFRTPNVNWLIGGAENSSHMFGRAADVIPIGVAPGTAFSKIKASAVQFDQCILECDAWLHLSISAAGHPARRQSMIATGGPGNWVYTSAADN
jgi:hypothetical protein